MLLQKPNNTKKDPRPMHDRSQKYFGKVMGVESVIVARAVAPCIAPHKFISFENDPLQVPCHPLLVCARYSAKRSRDSNYEMSVDVRICAHQPRLCLCKRLVVEVQCTQILGHKKYQNNLSAPAMKAQPSSLLPNFKKAPTHSNRTRENTKVSN